MPQTREGFFWALLSHIAFRGKDDSAFHSKPHAMSIVPVPMVDVRIMRMAVDQLGMDVPVAMRFILRDSVGMFMTVMLVMNMPVLMCDRAVRMLVMVSFR